MVKVALGLAWCLRLTGSRQQQAGQEAGPEGGHLHEKLNISLLLMAMSTKDMVLATARVLRGKECIHGFKLHHANRQVSMT